MMLPEAVESTGLAHPARGVASLRAQRRHPLAVIALMLAGATMSELLLMRLFYRIGIYLPKQGAFGNVYRVGTAAGSFAFNLASILAFLGLAVIAWRAWSLGRHPEALVMGAFLLVTAAAILSHAEPAMPVARLIFVMLAVGVCLAAARARGDGAFRLAMVGAGLVVLFSTFAGTATDAVLLGRQLPGVAGAQILAEWMTVVTSVLLFLAWWRDGSPSRWGPIIVGVTLAVLLVTARVANGSVTGILALWTSGLRLSAPIGVYAVALGCFSCAGAGWARRRPWRSLGLFFMLAGGIIPASSYALMLVLLGLIFATDGVALGGLPAWRSIENDPAR